jgi:hypothetical protein
MIPPLVATEGWSPHFLRVLGLAAPLGVTIGLGAAEFVDQARRRWSGPGSGHPIAPIAAITAVALTLSVVALTGGWTYLGRPVADRYTAYSYEIAAAGQYAADHPGSVVIIDGFSGTDIEFLQWANLPAIVSPGSRLDNPKAYTAIVAMTKADLTGSLGAELGDRAEPVAWDPSGKPMVWAVTP